MSDIKSFFNWLKNQNVGVDYKTKDILVAREGKWELASEIYENEKHNEGIVSRLDYTFNKGYEKAIDDFVVILTNRNHCKSYSFNSVIHTRKDIDLFNNYVADTAYLLKEKRNEPNNIIYLLLEAERRGLIE